MKIVYDKPKGGITRIHIFLAVGYIFGGNIKGSFEFPKDEQEAVESIKHFKLLTKYSEYLSLI